MIKRENVFIVYYYGVLVFIFILFIDILIIQVRLQMECYCGLDVGYDEFGVEWIYVLQVKVLMFIVGKIMFDDIVDWREYVKFLDLEVVDWEKQVDIDVYIDFMVLVVGVGIVFMVDGKSVYDEDKFVLCMVINGFFECLYVMMGFENVLMVLVFDLDECYEYFKVVVDWKIEYFRKIVKYYKVDVINLYDDYGVVDWMFMVFDIW